MESVFNAEVALQLFVALHVGMAVFQSLAVAFQYHLAAQVGSREHALWGAAWGFMALCHLGYALIPLTAEVPGTFESSTVILPGATVLAGHLALLSLFGAFLELRGYTIGWRALTWLVGAGLVLATGPGLFSDSRPAMQVSGYAWQLSLAAVGCLLSGPLLFIQGRTQDGRSLRVLGGSLTLYSLPLSLAAWVTLTEQPASNPEVIQKLSLIGCLDFTFVAVLGFSLVETVLDRSRRVVEEKLEIEQILHGELERHTARHRALLDQVPASLFIINEHGYCLNELQPGKVPFGLAQEDLPRAPFFDLIRERLHKEDLEAASRVLSWNPADENSIRSEVLRFTGPEGERVVAVRAQRLEHLGGLAITTTDVTEQQRLERRLFQTEQLESVGRLAAGVVHDFNNLLSVYEVTISALQRAGDLSPLQRELLLELEQATERGAALTRPLLALAGSPTRERVVLDASALLLAFLPVARRLLPDSVDLRWTKSEAPLAIHCDRGKFEQVLVNLVTNSRDAMPNGGTLSISVGENTSGEVAIQVKDSGEGMDAATLSKALEPFFTTKPLGRGTGIGLSTCRKIVEADGGSITLHSELGHGTLVVLTYPQVEQALLHDEAGQELESGERLKRPLAGGRVLLVEDEPALRRNLRRVLGFAGYDVDDEPDGEAGFKKFLQNDDYICVVTDIAMPKMTGDSMAEGIWKRCPDMPVVFMSGYTERGFMEPGVPRNAQFLTKPFASAGMLRTIEQLVQKRHAQGGTPRLIKSSREAG